MEAATANDSQLVRRFNPLRGFRRGLKAACRWTMRFGRGRSSAAPGGRGRRTGRVRGAPLASLSAAMLEPDGILDPGDEPYITPTSIHHQVHTPLVAEFIGSADAAINSGSSFPIVLRRPVYDADSPPSPHLHPRRTLQYHVNADDVDLYQLHSPHHHNHHPASLHNLEETSWTHHHTDLRSNPACDCGGWAEGTGCSGRCPTADNGTHAHRRAAGRSCTPTAITSASLNICRRGDDGGGSGGSRVCSEQGVRGEVQCQSQGYSLQHLLAVGSRQWGSGGWWDGRGFLRVKIYDFAIYADPAKASYAIRSGGGTSPGSRTLDCGGDGPAASTATAGGGGRSPAEVVVSPSSRVDMSLTIRACRNLPLQLLSQEFERILQRRHEKAGGRADDPAFQELLSYFSREKLPEHVLTTTTTTMASAGSSVSRGDAVRKGASITFSRSSSGALLTEAGGRVLGLVQSPALAEALFDLYLGDQPVSKKAKAAAGAALLEIAGREGGGDYRYRPQAGERLVCGTGPRGIQDLEACALQVS
ncbi:hypothetical protein Vretimale_7397 [Volvox reticuliferus]|uniref:Uncharacterized protein n=1 Tax=Volvox reticuliferus TaxID=1737510 RepID=A0A8J4CG41_9CHLO|nr:hypothetical protein Vretifemale_7489 [Volvox reticuliferus]GIM02558.1 hypothetical protein Vretimale_7397 [Volvox reticuliferus]